MKKGKYDRDAYFPIFPFFQRVFFRIEQTFKKKGGVSSIRFSFIARVQGRE
jgi:hypothetical protein